VALLSALGVAVGVLIAIFLGIEATKTRRVLAREQLGRRLGPPGRPRGGAFATAVTVEGPIARRLQRLLVRAGEPMTVDGLLLRVGIASTLGVVGLSLVNGTAGALLGVAAGVIPLFSVYRQGITRTDALGRQLPEAFDLMSRALRGGHALPDALHRCGREMPGPLGPELALAAERNRLGLDLRTCMLELADRQAGSFDLHLFVSMVLLHQETGGNLIETLDHLATTIRERMVARDKLAALTAEVRMSATIVGILPFFVGAVLLVIRPDYLTPLMVNPLGQKLAIVGIGSLLVGFAAMRRLMQVEEG
jgi:tight adherence protein B